MTLVVLGVDALDPDLVDPDSHPNLSLRKHSSIDTINSSAGSPSTHELWPTIITGLEPEKHGLVLDDGVAWENPALAFGSTVADYVLPQSIQMRIGGWLLNNTDQDAFRVPATYYEEEGISTVFDDRQAVAIGVPNYVTDPNSEDREHQLRRRMGDLFERDLEAKGGHSSSDPEQFYELCLEMSMIRIARTRRALRSRQNELVFGYTSGLDLIGHVSYDRPEMQRAAYDELDQFVGELRNDLTEKDDLVLVSDHGLQDGVHTERAMIASTDPDIVEEVESVLDIRAVIEGALADGNHQGAGRSFPVETDESEETKEEVHSRLEDLGYM